MRPPSSATYAVEPEELSEIAENHEVYRDLLGLLHPQHSREKNRV